MGSYVPINGTMKQRAFEYILSTTGADKRLLCSNAITKPAVEGRALFVWIIRTFRPGVSYHTMGQWLGGRLGVTARKCHQKAIRLRLVNADFDLLCRNFEAEMQAILEGHDA